MDGGIVAGQGDSMATYALTEKAFCFGPRMTSLS
jgi:hypothetical protein